MGYKYRNGSTPDHVDSSMSGPKYPHVGVDTAQVKKRIDNDSKSYVADIDRKHQAQEDMYKTTVPSKDSRDNYKAANDRLSILNNRIKVNKDTLDRARKGKIPAKP